MENFIKKENTATSCCENVPGPAPGKDAPPSIALSRPRRRYGLPQKDWNLTTSPAIVGLSVENSFRVVRCTTLRTVTPRKTQAVSGGMFSARARAVAVWQTAPVPNLKKKEISL